MLNEQDHKINSDYLDKFKAQWFFFAHGDKPEGSV